MLEGLLWYIRILSIVFIQRMILFLSYYFIYLSWFWIIIFSNCKLTWTKSSWKWPFSDQICPFSVVVGVVVVVNFSHFHLFQNHFKLDTKHPCRNGSQFFFKWWVISSSKGRDFFKSENSVGCFQNHLLQNHWVNFNQIWCKASLEEEHANLFKLRARSSSVGR